MSTNCSICMDKGDKVKVLVFYQAICAIFSLFAYVLLQGGHNKFLHIPRKCLSKETKFRERQSISFITTLPN